MTMGLFHGEAFPPSATRVEGKGVPSPESSGGRDGYDCSLLSCSSWGWHIELLLLGLHDCGPSSLL